jgi:hypothetical protein
MRPTSGAVVGLIRIEAWTFNIRISSHLVPLRYRWTLLISGLICPPSLPILIPMAKSTFCNKLAEKVPSKAPQLPKMGSPP